MAAYVRSMHTLMKHWAENNIMFSFNDVAYGVKLTKRQRFTIAEINAGAEFLPAIPGFGYRLDDAKMISIGGAVGATTTVDILGTLAGSSRKLLAVAIAALTQSAIVRMGATNAVVLADGASLTRNDIGTAITVGKTGATATTATHVDVIASYIVERENN